MMKRQQNNKLYNDKAFIKKLCLKFKKLVIIFCPFL